MSCGSIFGLDTSYWPVSGRVVGIGVKVKGQRSGVRRRCMWCLALGVAVEASELHLREADPLLWQRVSWIWGLGSVKGLSFFLASACDGPLPQWHPCLCSLLVLMGSASPSVGPSHRHSWAFLKGISQERGWFPRAFLSLIGCFLLLCSLGSIQVRLRGP